MAWLTHPTISDGDAWSASDQNNYVKGNLDTLFPYSAGQQIAFSTSTTSLNKATAAAMTFLRSNITNTAIEFGSLVYARQGNSASAWWTTSTSTTVANYTPSNSLFQAGNFSLPSTTVLTITFPQVYANPPIVFLQATVLPNYFTVASVSSASFNAQGSSLAFYPTAMTWFSIGQV